MTDPPLRLIELWLTLVHGALCRQVAGGLLAKLPADAGLSATGVGEQIGLVFPNTDREKLEQEASRLFSSSYLVEVVNDLRRQASTAQPDALSLRRVLSELQSYLVDERAAALPADAELLAFYLRHGDYRSRHVPLRRVSYHIVPHPNGWQLNRQGSDDGETFATKDHAIQAGMDKARAHAAGQLIIHNADGTFEEGRTYGDDPRES